MVKDCPCITVGILCELWPSWVFGFANTTFSVLWIATYGDENHATFLQQNFPEIKVVSLIHIQISSLVTPSILACNGPFHGSIPPPFGPLLVFFDWNVRLRKWFGWKILYESISHVTCGGVSDGVFPFKAACKHGAIPNLQWNLPMVHLEPQADIGAILGCRLGGTSVTVAPRLPQLDIPVAHLVGGNTYHYRGLYPLLTKFANFLIPCVWARPVPWVRRKLSLEEMLSVYDVPLAFTALLSTGAQKRILRQLTVPHKVYSSVVSKLCVGLRVHTTSSSSADMSSAYYETSSCYGGGKKGQELVEQSSLPSNWLKNEVHNKDEGAAKAENSAIPIYLWDDVLSHQLSIPLSKSHRQALGILRRWSIQLWKRRLTRSFTHWFRCSVCNGLYGCISCKKYFRKQQQHNTMVSISEGYYCWAATGRRAYTRWRHIYFQVGKGSRIDRSKSALGGVDCLTRAAGCTEW